MGTSENLELCSNEITLASILEEEKVSVKPFESRLEIIPHSLKDKFSKGLVSDIIQIVEKLDLSLSIRADASVPVIVIREKKKCKKRFSRKKHQQKKVE